MTVFAEPPLKDFAILRVVRALKQYAPPSVQFVDSEDSADLVIIYVHGRRRHTWWRVDKILKRHQKYAIMQLCLRSTSNPKTEDWLNIWGSAEVVWSYYDLPKLCVADDNPAKFNFYYAPLGVDEVFRETKLERTYLIAAGNHQMESSHEVKLATDGKIFKLGGGLSDEELARQYSQCQYVSGLRRIEGFEMPVLEGLACGARPICFDQDHYKHWFGDLAEYIPEVSRTTTTARLKALLQKAPRPVTDQEKQLVRDKFNWQAIIKGFWRQLA